MILHVNSLIVLGSIQLFALQLRVLLIVEEVLRSIVLRILEVGIYFLLVNVFFLQFLERLSWSLLVGQLQRGLSRQKILLVIAVVVLCLRHWLLHLHFNAIFHHVLAVVSVQSSLPIHRKVVGARGLRKSLTMAIILLKRFRSRSCRPVSILRFWPHKGCIH